MTNLYDPRLDSHCGSRGCPCPHRDPCYRGWEEYFDDDMGVRTVPCLVCRANLRRIVDEARDRPSMMRALQDPKRGMNPYPQHDRQWTGASS